MAAYGAYVFAGLFNKLGKLSCQTVFLRKPARHTVVDCPFSSHSFPANPITTFSCATARKSFKMSGVKLRKFWQFYTFFWLSSTWNSINNLVTAGDHTSAIRIPAQQLSAGQYVLPWQAASAIDGSQIWEISNPIARMADCTLQIPIGFLFFEFWPSLNVSGRKSWQARSPSKPYYHLLVRLYCAQRLENH